MDIIVTVITVTLLLGFLVFIHEGGHYLAARAFKVRVSEFMIGLPGPSVGFTRGETRFGVTAVPLGGYASICGMAPASNNPQLKRVLGYAYRKGTVYMEDTAHDLFLSEEEAYELLEELSDWGSLKRPRRKDKANVYRVPAKDGQTEGAPRPQENLEAFFASEKQQQYCSLPFWKRCTILLAGPAMNLLWVFLAFIIVYSIMGLDLQNTQTGVTIHRTWAPWESVVLGFKYLGMVVTAIIGLFNPATAAETVSNSTSVVGIAVMSKSALDAGFMDFLFFTAVISASLGLMNMLPIPPLDGGRFVIEVFQKITRKVVSLRAMGYMSTAGIVLFAGFFLVMLNQDVQRFVFGNWG